MTTTLLFDYGGTLDTNGIHWSHVIWQGYGHAGAAMDFEKYKEAYVCGERALAVPGVVLKEDVFSVVLHKKIAAQFQYLGIEDALELQEKVVGYCDEVARTTTAKSKEILQQLSEKFKLILVSNFYGNLKCVLSEYGLLSLFADVVESGVVGVRKPDPEIFSLALQRNHLTASECVVIGDSLKNDIVPAQSLKMKSVWLNNGGWGSGEMLKDKSNIEIHDLEDILRVFGRARSL